jgi:hypothetical protein
MRTVSVAFAIWLCFVFTNTAQAEQRMFIIANDADGYGVDRCLASGEKCGAAAANAYCKMQAFAQAANYHKVDRGDITGVIPVVSTECSDNGCDVVAIVCTR